MRPILFAIAFIALIFSITQGGMAGAEETKGTGVEILLQQRIPLKDGIHLSATIYKPADMKKPLPAIFSLTPYIADEGQTRGIYFAKNGYIYLQVDVRGRGNSGGHFFPLAQDGPDGAQVVEWIAKQPWCSGSVAMRGGSYRGMTQWQTLQHFPPALKTIVPTASVCPGIDAPFSYNIFYGYVTRWLAFTTGHTGNRNLFGDSEYWMAKFYEWYSQHLPFSKLADVTGSNKDIFKRYLAHPYYDDFWKSLTPSPRDYEKIDIPILSITGHFDGDQPGALHYYKQHMRYGNDSAKRKHFLIVGPWTHSGTRTPVKEFGGLIFGENSVINMEQLHLEWYDWILKGKKKPGFLKKRVAYYMMNRNEWEYADSFDRIANGTMTWYLSSKNGSAHDVFHSGFLKPAVPTVKQEPDVFQYDPLKILSKEEYFEASRNQSPLDASLAFADDKLIYHSPPLREAVEVAGTVSFTGYIEMNVPDTDLSVSLFEIRKNGKCIRLAAEMMRARFRKSLSKPVLVTPGNIETYVFERSFFFARRLEKGSRLRLIVTCVNLPDYQKNYNSGGDVREETSKDARTATIKLYHNKKHPSKLVLPVLDNRE